jgi:hypothetical protein
VVQINPVIEGFSPDDFPSASIVVSKHFHRWDHLSALGAVGDIGRRAFDNPVVMKHLDSAGIGKRDALKIVDMIDSNYVLMDKKGVESAVGTLIRTDPGDLLNIPEWNSNLEIIVKTIDKQMESVRVSGDIAFVEFSSDYQIISKIARKLVWDLGHKIAVAVNRDFNGSAQVYVRRAPGMTVDLDMSDLIERIKGIGVNCGGKEEVMGSIFETKMIDQVKSIIFNQLGQEEKIK